MRADRIGEINDTRYEEGNGDARLQRLLFPGQPALAFENPLSAELGEMRLSLWPGLVESLRFNLRRQQSRVRLFEVGHLFQTHTLSIANKSLGIQKTVRVTVSEIGVAEEKIVFGRGMVRVVSRPWATVYVDGVEKGRTPIQFAVYEGEHTLRLVSGESTDERIFPINVKAGDPEKLITIKF